MAAQFGDPDIYVSVDTAPTQSEHGWSAMRAGSDMLVVSNETGAGWCAPCSYVVGVRAFSASAFWLTASSMSAHTTGWRVVLAEGLPFRGRVSSDAPAAFDLFVESADHPIKLDLTSLTGDADLFASFDVLQPTRGNSSWKSMLGSGSGDRLLIMPLDAGWPTSLPATLHIVVESWASAWATSGSNAEFTLVASGLTPTQLLAGSPQTGSVAYGEGAFYRFSTSPTERGPISISISATDGGDPDLFLAASSSPVSKEACTSGAVVCWKSTALGADGIHVEPDDPNYCSGCDSSLLVYGAGPYASNSSRNV